MKRLKAFDDKGRILFIVQLPPPVHGASQMNKYVVENPLIHKKYDIVILPLKFIDKISEVGKFSLKKILLTFVFTLKLVRTIILYRPDLVYFTVSPFGGAFYRDALFISIIKLSRCKILFHLHGKGIKNNIDKRPWILPLYKFVFNNTSLIHLSKSLLYDIEPFRKKLNDIFIIPNGIPEANLKEIKPFHASKDIIRIIYLSNLKTSKGILVLMDALKLLRDDYNNFEATVVGSPADISIESLKEIVLDNNLDKNVKIVGPKYGHDKYYELLKADIFVFPTYYENECFPLSILEAIQTNNAVISTDNGAIKEIITDNENGFIVEQKNAIALSHKIINLIENRELLEKMKKENKLKYLEKYTLQTFNQSMVLAIDKLFQKPLNANGNN